MKLTTSAVLSLLLFSSLFSSSPASAAPMTMLEANKVTTLVSLLVQDKHYSQHPIDAEIEKLHLQNYLNTLDPTHAIFFQSDVNEFRTMKPAEKGIANHKTKVLVDATPGFVIFEVYLKRLARVVDLVKDLTSKPLDLNGKDTLASDRKKSPWPKDEAEQRNLLSQQIRFSLLTARVTDDKLVTEKQQIAKRYTRMLSNMKEMSEKSQSEVLNFYLSALTEAFDPHSDYMGPENAEDFAFQMGAKELHGIGAILSEVDGYVTIMALSPGGPAALSKQFHPKDRIIAVGQGDADPVDVVGMRLSEVVKMIRGQKGTKVSVTVQSNAATDTSHRKITVIRDTLRVEEQRASAKIIDFEENHKTLHLGVITLPMFYEDCSIHVKNLLEAFVQAKVDGVVLDLRNDGGGSLPEAINLVGLFIPVGPVVQTRDSSGAKQILADQDPSVSYAGPLTVMTNEGSASASEIVAAALQDLCRAVIVGDSRTHGKGSVQSVMNLKEFLKGFDPGMLKVTTAKFYRINGATTQLLGVKPDIILHEAFDGGESTLDRALKSDTIEPIKYASHPISTRVIAELRQRSVARVTANPEFKYVAEDVARSKVNAKAPIILSKADFEAKKKKLDTLIAARAAERAKRTPIKHTEKLLAIDLKTGLVKAADSENSKLDRNKDLATDDQKSLIEESEAHQKAELEEGLSILSDWIGNAGSATLAAKTPAEPASHE